MSLSQTNWPSESKYNKTQDNQVRHMTEEKEHERPLHIEHKFQRAEVRGSANGVSHL